MTIAQAIAGWLAEFANVRPNRKGQVGRLKLYDNRTEVPQGRLDCIAVDVIAEHVNQPKALVYAAIGSMMPLEGTGAKLHVVIMSPERIARDLASNKLKRETMTDAQRAHRLAYLRAFGLTVDLPAFVYVETPDSIN